MTLHGYQVRKLPITVMGRLAIIILIPRLIRILKGSWRLERDYHFWAAKI